MGNGKSTNRKPHISDVTPGCGDPGRGIADPRPSLRAPTGRGDLRRDDRARAGRLGRFVIARVPEGASGGELVVHSDEQHSSPWACEIGVQVADSLHPVSNPAVDPSATCTPPSAARAGRRRPCRSTRSTLNYTREPFITELMNATALCFDRSGMLYVSSRYDGIVYQATPKGKMSVYVEGMGVATGIAFDAEGNLYVGDRSGTIFKISRNRQIFVFATLEPSIAAYHLAFGPGGYLYVTGPTTSSFDAVHRISPAGEVEVFYRGLGRPQGMAFDEKGSCTWRRRWPEGGA